MQRVLAAVLSLTVAWHAMLGCCWHHAHAATASDSGSCGPTHCDHAQRDHGHCDHSQAGHGHDEPSQGDEGEPQSPEPCEKNSCLFVRGEQVRALDHFDELAFTPHVEWSAFATMDAICLPPAPEDGSPPPTMPRHLRFSVLLI